MEYVSHPLIKENAIERRAYQIAIAATALMRNTLVILPTGLGKTAVALLVIASRLHNEGGKALVLAPTKPLVEQHASFFRKNLRLNSEEVIALSGETPPEKRAELWEKARLIVSTPQVVENDVLAGRISLKDVVHITFDEAHRAVGEYSYVYIAEKYFEEAKKPLVLAMTASPGSDVERIREVIKNLGIEEIEIRTEHDEDVKPYVFSRKIEWIKVDMPEELKAVRQKFEEALKLRFKKLERLGVTAEGLSKKELLALQESLQAEAAETGDSRLFEAVSVLAEVLKIQHGMELIETQGLDALKEYLKRLIREARSKGGSRAAKSIIGDPLFMGAVTKAAGCRAEHPKLEKLKEVVKKQLEEKPDSRIIVFTNFRDTAEVIVEELKKEGIPVSRFVGQAKRFEKKGMSQKEQVETLERFRSGEIKVLVATSVGEEGLDIPSTDLVVFYEAVPSEIRAIQRKGRTGRAREGRIVVLITKGTRDEAYYWASMRKEKAMYLKLYELKESLKPRGQASLEDFAKPVSLPEEIPKAVVYVDSRESSSGIAKKLSRLGFSIKIQNLEVADYVVSDRVAIERKTTEDFVESIVNKDRDIFSQLVRLKKHYPRPVLIIEGEGIYGRLNPNAIRGAIAAIAVDLGIPIVQTRSADETAEFIAVLARREQEFRKREIVLHAGKTKKTLKEMQEYVVSAISDIGPVIARNLLEHFQTIERIATASEEELMKVPKIGKKTAEKIRKLMTTPYSEAEKFEL
ncbi:DEAD/DEAH box helicase [Archaeoglobus veneficus]|uniref:Helicase domain protein n=1 Tax=Archaeoglobus veneficus (strain DSM 11195 / SNP6) TaxID=693661 RepID=F2KQU8_ARCVS|nr:DEAD/DEAH box helicase [Archaeoglobus veneficus]AEA47754.1 helicase domain protein [Archaeoglobus veneficus SNP6]